MTRVVAALLFVLSLLAGLPASAAAPRGSFTRKHFSAAPGLERDYWVYRPSRLAFKHVPLVVYLHGCSQNAADAAGGTRWNELAEKKGFIAVYPDQRTEFSIDGSEPHGNGSGCWNWFNPGDQSRGRGEPATIAGITRRVMSEYPIDPRRVYVMGASAGGDMASILGAAYPDLYAAIGVLAGCAYQSCSDVTGSNAYAQMGSRARVMPVFAVQSATDDLNVFALGAGMVRQWLGTDDFADDGTLNLSVPRTPARREDHGLDSSAVSGLGTTGDPCIREQSHTCPGGLLGLKGSYPHTVERYVDSRGRSLIDFWIIYGATHSYTGGDPDYSYTDPLGPDITSAAYRFFLAHPMR